MRDRTESLKKRNYEGRKDQGHFPERQWNQRRQQTAEDKPNSHSSLRISARPEIFRGKQFIRISGKMEGTITHIAEP
jgi:hypothetical protein